MRGAEMTVEMFEIQKPSYEQIEKNRKLGNTTTKYNDECFVCERPMKTTGMEKGTWVHLSFMTGMIMNIEQSQTEEGQNQSQGYFPVGSDCVKAIPKRFVYKAAK
jgi:hypothetical protein